MEEREKKMRKKQFYATCVDYPNPNELIKIVEKGKSISRRRFLRECAVSPKLVREMKRFPHDYSFYRSKSKKKEIYYFEWSMIEHLFK